MVHYTLNTGDTRWCPRSSMLNGAIDIFLPLTESGERPLPDPLGSYQLVVSDLRHGFYATISRRGTPLVTIGVADTAEAADTIWPRLERLYHEDVNGRPTVKTRLRALERPSRLPWLSAVIVGPASEIGCGGDWYDHATETTDWLRDVERCVAWAWLDRRA